MPPVSQAHRPCRECGALMLLKITRDFSRKFFCSRSCSTRFYGRQCDMRRLWANAYTPEANAKKGRRGSASKRWVEVGTVRAGRADGYVEVKTPEGWQYLHRVVAKAPLELLVHHKDHNPRNNDPANLELMTRGEHSAWHGRSRRDFGRRWSVKYESCLECSTVEREHVGHGYCTACYQRRKKHASVIGSSAQGDACGCGG